MFRVSVESRKLSYSIERYTPLYNLLDWNPIVWFSRGFSVPPMGRYPAVSQQCGVIIDCLLKRYEYHVIGSSYTHIVTTCKGAA